MDNSTILENQSFIFVFSLLLLAFFSIVVFLISLKILFFINLRLKKLKLQKMAKKKKYNNYTLRLNHKGMPIMLVNINDPTDIVLL